jgi:flagellar hook-basal body complex protein FliE
MNVEPIEFLPPSSPVAPWDAAPEALAGNPGAHAANGFGSWFTQQLERVNNQIAQSEGQLQALAAGEAQNLHQVMISLEEARLSFQLLAQVRNRVLEAYQEVMRMQL